MSSAALRQKLTTMRQLTSKAIYSDESREVLGALWMEVRKIASNVPLLQDDKSLLAELSYNHHSLANTMFKAESYLEELLDDVWSGSLDLKVCE